MKTVIEMAREAGITFKLMIVEGLEYDYREVNLNDNIGGDEFGCIERFADLVRADEREACAKVCDDLALPPDVARSDASIWDVATLDCAEAIRARSNT